MLAIGVSCMDLFEFLRKGTFTFTIVYVLLVGFPALLLLVGTSIDVYEQISQGYALIQARDLVIPLFGVLLACGGGWITSCWFHARNEMETLKKYILGALLLALVLAVILLPLGFIYYTSSNGPQLT